MRLLLYRKDESNYCSYMLCLVDLWPMLVEGGKCQDYGSTVGTASSIYECQALAMEMSYEYFGYNANKQKCIVSPACTNIDNAADSWYIYQNAGDMNTCTCPNGTPTVGSGTDGTFCEVDGDEDCSACYSGYVLSATAGAGSQTCAGWDYQ
jgi:hypothetical protein